MTDHHDPGHEHDFDAGDFLPVDEHHLPGPDNHPRDDFDHDDFDTTGPEPEHDAPGWAEPHHEELFTVADQHVDVAAEPDAPVNDEPVDLFPPQVDVGPLPEPVDGFPWVDPSSLGLIDAGPVDAAALAGAPDPHELAEYAAEELPPAVDPWAALAESDDPATAALAKFYRPDPI